MKKIRIGKDIALKWAILTNSKEESLHGRNLKLFLTTPLLQQRELDFTVSGNVVEAKVYGVTQKVLGVYSLTLWENYNTAGQSAVDACNAFALVPTTCQEEGTDSSLDIETVDLTIANMEVGYNGASAYEIAVVNGFVGTEKEWLASLKQPALDAAGEAEIQIKKMINLQNEVSKAEQKRVSSEQSRSEAETAREQQEASRVEAEQGRVSSEQSRTEAENVREQQEASRVEAEQQRVSSEQSRSEAETAREQQEASRVEAEQGRVSSEQSRTEEETVREQQEASRVEAEQERVLSEQSRTEAETVREQQEASRVEAEEGRVQTFSQLEKDINTLKSEADTVIENTNNAVAQATQAAANAIQASETANSAAQSASNLEKFIEQSEQTRVLAEQERVESETLRQQAEQQRVLSEQSRAEAESTREQQEASRVEAEEGRIQSFSQLEKDINTLKSEADTVIEEANGAIENVNQAAEAVDGRITDIETQIDNMEKEGNALVSDIAAGKELVAQAITNKGVITSGTDSFEKMAENIGQIYKGAYDDSFKVKINDNLPSPEVERVGSAVFPNWLEDNIRNVMFKDGVINYYLDRTNSRLKDNGLPANVDGSDGDVMIILPRFWYSMVFTAEGVEITFSNVGQTSEGWKESPEIYIGASEGVIQTTGGKDYLRSCYNTTAEFRGGSHGSTNATWDDLPKSLLGMARTSKNHDAFRTACLNKVNNGTGIYHQFDYRTYFKLLLMFMAVYGTRNIQDEHSGIDLTTGEDKRNSDGFKYGGLGRGVADCGAWWNSFNSLNPFVKTDVSYDLGCRSGVIDYPVNTGTEESPVVQMVKVPVLWGIANPYGHIFKCMDGITKQVVEIDGKKHDRWALFYNPKFYKSSGQTDADEVIDIPTVNSGYIKKMDGNFLPTMVGGSESSYWSDYLWASSNLQSYVVFNGGSASFGGSCGLASVASSDGVGSARSNGGGRLCFSPS